MSEQTVPPDLREELVSACRTTVGDDLRSLVYFTPTEATQLYLRDDLEADADIVGFADNERLGFRSSSIYADSELGDYRFTVRAFERGYLTRVIAGDHGAFVTTDAMAIDRFHELASAVRSILAAAD